MSNQQIFDESKKYMPGGVNSPVRAYRDMGIDPPVMKSGKGVIIKDEDGNVVFHHENMETGIYEVKVSGKCVVRVTAKEHKGSFCIGD